MIRRALIHPLFISGIFSLAGTGVFAMEDSGSSSSGGIDMGGSCPADASYANMVAGGEGGAAGQYATNPGSTATGTYQFTYGTLKDLGYISADSPKPTALGRSDWSTGLWTVEAEGKRQAGNT